MNLLHFAGLERESTGEDRVAILLMSKAFGLTIQRAPDYSAVNDSGSSPNSQ